MFLSFIKLSLCNWQLKNILALFNLSQTNQDLSKKKEKSLDLYEIFIDSVFEYTYKLTFNHWIWFKKWETLLVKEKTISFFKNFWKNSFRLKSKNNDKSN